MQLQFSESAPRNIIKDVIKLSDKRKKNMTAMLKKMINFLDEKYSDNYNNCLHMCFILKNLMI
jgi:hypothetical protein